ncbi:hypothetical protein E3N88_08385 [Mikania micrantha]|uniref:AIR9-like A9 domain-containing protein n=1 Tax=Mikania micrantha TaxID=192012 RepID=A0A5N6PG26_9ASTR|nr:hypothetical protein E3N88_08385 [Mikania micrantha]
MRVEYTEIFEDAHKNSNRDRASFLFNGQADQSLDSGHHHNLERRFQDLVTDDYQQPPPVSDADDSCDLEDGPGIEGLMITGDPKPGRTLRSCGYAVRGTIECMFQWARHFEDGTLEYIVGATNPEYVVTADDVDKVIALECVPVDSQGRQGKVVRVFANDQKKITVASKKNYSKFQDMVPDDYRQPPPVSDADDSYDLEDGPGIEGLEITGDPKPEGALLGCGYAVRGTSTCMFQWVRYYEDGTSEYIEGATNPEYVVTADDVDKYIALECIPMNNQGRQGKVVRVFANDQKKITASKINYSKFQDLANEDYHQPPPISDADDSYDLEGKYWEVEMNRLKKLFAQKCNLQFEINASLLQYFNTPNTTNAQQ